MSATTLDRVPRLDAVPAPVAAERLGVTRVTMVQWINKGHIKAGRIGRRYYVPISEIERLISGVMGDQGATSDDAR